MKYQTNGGFHEKLRSKIDRFVHDVYAVTKRFPKTELYGATSQVRRASMSAMLNYVEGYARRRKPVVIQFFEISYGSLKEALYLVDFAAQEGWMGSEDWDRLSRLGSEIGAMLWKTLEHLREKQE